MKATLILDTRRPLKDGSFPVKISVGHSTRLYINTEISVRKEDWDPVTATSSGVGCRQVNLLLHEALNRVQRNILNLKLAGKDLQGYSLKEQREILLGGIDKQKHILFLDTAQKMLGERSYRSATLESFDTTLKKIQLFDNTALLSDITPSWLRAFENSMSAAGLSVNSRSHYLRNIRNVMNYAVDEGYTDNYPFRKFKIRQQSTRHRCLSGEQLREIIHLENLNGSAALARDVFVLMFTLIGINMIDLSKLTHKNIVNGYLEYRRRKTDRLYSIKLEPETVSLIEKYKGDRHLLYMFDNYRNYKNFLKLVNRELGQLSSLVGYKLDGSPITEVIEPDLTTYWSRHTWATIAYSIGVPQDIVSAALGHSSGNRVTSIYIDTSSAPVNEANRKVLDFVFEK